MRSIKFTLFILIASAIAPLSSFGQRSVDLESYDIAKPTTIRHGQVSDVIFVVQNNGPDVLNTDDTVTYRFTINNTINTNQVITPVRKELKEGDTMHVRSRIPALNVRGLSFNGPLCVQAAALNRSLTDSVKWEGYANTFNDNRLCKTIAYINEQGWGVSVNEVSLYKQEVGIYPNPTNDHFTVSFFNPSANEVHIELLDLKGQKVRQIAQEEMKRGDQKVDVKTNDLKPGVYVVRLQTGEHVVSKRVLIQ